MRPASLSAASLLALLSSSPAAGVSLGLNFSASDSTLANSGFIPPDTMGSVGPNHIMVLLNGRASVYNKSTGSLVGSGKSLNQFWTDAGATPQVPSPSTLASSTTKTAAAGSPSP